MKERLIIITVALISGLFITSAGFFIYQSTKKSNDPTLPKKLAKNETQTVIANENKIFVKISEPVDEAVTQKRTIQIKGATNPENTVVVSTNLQDMTGKPTKDGSFAFTVDIAAGANVINTRSITPDGESVEDSRSITYSTEQF